MTKKIIARLLLLVLFVACTWLHYFEHGELWRGSAAKPMIIKEVSTPPRPPLIALDVPQHPFVETESMVRESLGTAGLAAASTMLQRCSITTQYRLIVSSSEEQPLWILQSLQGPDGTPKAVGGDELYVVWNASTTEDDVLVALVDDPGDGTYALDFVLPPLLTHRQQQGERKQQHKITSTTPPSDTGTLTIYLEYSCGLGSVMPPHSAVSLRFGCPSAASKMKTTAGVLS